MPFRLLSSHCVSDPSASASSEAGLPVLPPQSLLTPSEGRDHSGEVGVPHVGSCEVSPPPPSVLGFGGGGGITRALASAGAGNSAAYFLPWEGVAGSSRSQESLVLADPLPVQSFCSPFSKAYSSVTLWRTRRLHR